MQIWPLMNCLELKKVEPQHEEGPREWQTWANYIRNREVPLYESFFSPHILLLLTRRPLYKALCYKEVLLYMDFEHLEFASYCFPWVGPFYQSYFKIYVIR